MAVIKTWTIEAHNLVYGRIALWFDEDTQALNWHRGYYYTDANGERISFSGVDFGIKQEAQGSMPWANIPLNIQQALTEIDTYIKSQILLQEGL